MNGDARNHIAVGGIIDNIRHGLNGCLIPEFAFENAEILLSSGDDVENLLQ